MYHRIFIVGNLGRDPVMRYTTRGHAVTSFPVATNRRWTNDDGTPANEVTWFQVSAWGKLGEICNQYLTKGRQVFIDGRLRSDTETGAPRIWAGKDGQARASFEIVANSVKFLGGRPEHDGQAEQDNLPGLIDSEDIPF